MSTSALVGFASPALCQGNDPAQDVPVLDPIFQGRGIETDFVLLESRIPGFGGAYLDDNGDIVAHVPDPSDERARAVIGEAFLSQVWAPRGAAVRLVKGDYAMSELITWSLRMVGAAERDLRIVMNDADERANRVRIWTEDAALEARILELTTRLGVPPQAVVVEVGRTGRGG